MNDQQKKEILESPCYELFCAGSEECSECAFADNDDCEEIYDLMRINAVLEFQLSEEKTKVEKLKKLLLSSLQDIENNDLLDEISKTLKEIEE